MAGTAGRRPRLTRLNPGCCTAVCTCGMGEAISVKVGVVTTKMGYADGPSVAQTRTPCMQVPGMRVIVMRVRSNPKLCKQMWTETKRPCLHANFHIVLPPPPPNEWLVCILHPDYRQWPIGTFHSVGQIAKWTHNRTQCHRCPLCRTANNVRWKLFRELGMNSVLWHLCEKAGTLLPADPFTRSIQFCDSCFPSYSMAHT